MKIGELYSKYLNGERFKSMREIDVGYLPVKHPKDLVGNSTILQALAKRHSKSLKLYKNNPL